MKRLITMGILVCLTAVLAGCSGADDRQLQASLARYRLRHLPQIAAAPADLPAELAEARTDVPTADATWLAAVDQRAAREPADAEGQDEADKANLPYTPRQERRGPAYPGDFWRSFGRDAKELPASLWDDTKATFTNPWALAGFVGAAAAGVAIDASNGNGCVADHFGYRRGGHGSQLNTFWDTVGDVGGNPGTHFAVAGAMYFASLYRQDTKNYEVSKALINALALNGMMTIALKGITHTESPNGDPLGWPSGHTSSTFCLATVLHEAYGPWVGVPLFAFASFVGYERIDARNHDFNDVISGALIGIAIGHAVYQNHRPRVMGFDVIPYADPSRNAFGVALARQW